MSSLATGFQNLRTDSQQILRETRINELVNHAQRQLELEFRHHTPSETEYRTKFAQVRREHLTTSALRGFVTGTVIGMAHSVLDNDSPTGYLLRPILYGIVGAISNAYLFNLAYTNSNIERPHNH